MIPTQLFLTSCSHDCLNCYHIKAQCYLLKLCPNRSHFKKNQCMKIPKQAAEPKAFLVINRCENLGSNFIFNDSIYGNTSNFLNCHQCFICIAATFNSITQKLVIQILQLLLLLQYSPTPPRKHRRGFGYTTGLHSLILSAFLAHI